MFASAGKRAAQASLERAPAQVLEHNSCNPSSSVQMGLILASRQKICQPP